MYSDMNPGTLSLPILRRILDLLDHGHFYFGALWPVPVRVIPFES